MISKIITKSNVNNQQPHNPYMRLAHVKECLKRMLRRKESKSYMLFYLGGLLHDKNITDLQYKRLIEFLEKNT